MGKCVCQYENPDDAQVCANCGNRLGGEKKEKESKKNDALSEYSGDAGGAAPGYWGVSPEIESEIEKLQRELKKEIEEEDVDVDVDGFSTPATDKKVFKGRTNEEILMEYEGLADKIFFDLRNRAFVVGLKRKVLQRSREREWMSDGLLSVISQIEKHQRVPYQDQEWLAIMKEIERLLAESGLSGPLEMIREDTFVLEGKVNKIKFVMPRPTRVNAGK